MPKKVPSNQIDFDDAVKEAKEIIATDERNQWRLAELAHLVETQHGKKNLKKFAEAIGVCPNTLGRHRSVYRAWWLEI